jgi:hypothetical protein
MNRANVVHGILAVEKVSMKTKITRTKSSGKKRVKEVEPTYKFTEDDLEEMEEMRIGNRVVEALMELTRTGVVEWQVGEDWAGASLNIRLSKWNEMDNVERWLFIANNRELDGCGEAKEKMFEVEDYRYSEIQEVIHWNLE